MDIFASLIQPPDPQGDGEKGALLSLDTANSSLLGEEFTELATDSVKLFPDEEPPEAGGETMDSMVATDILSEMLNKMTGVTGAVAILVEQPPHPPETFSTEKVRLPDIPLMVSDNQIDKTDIAQQTLIPLAAAGDETRRGADSNPILPARMPVDFPNAQDQSKKAPADTPLNGQVSQLLDVDLSGRAVPSQENTNPQPEQAVPDLSDDMRPEPLRKAAIVELVHRPTSVTTVEPRFFAQNITALEPASLDATRAPVEFRPVQINPPALFRQITDTVVTMRDEIVEIRLSPEELGRIRMVLTGQDRAPHLTIWVERPEVLEQMRRQGDNLLQQLREQGMSGANLDFRDGRQAQNGSEQEQALPQGLSSHAKNDPMINIKDMPVLSRMTPLFSGRQGINIKV